MKFNLLEEYRLVDQVLTHEELEAIAARGEPVHIVMGQTFDAGQPLDLVKYALVIFRLRDYLEEAGARVRATWVMTVRAKPGYYAR